MFPLKIIVLGLLALLALNTTPEFAGRVAHAAPQPTVVEPAKIRQILEEYLELNQDVLPEGDIRFKTINLPQAFTIPAGTLQIEVIPSDPAIVRSRRFTLIFRVDGQVVENIVIRGELEVIAQVVVAAGDLPRGAILSPNDIKLAMVDLARQRNPLFDPNEVIGLRLKRSVRLGKPLSSRLVELPPIIKRGELVTITVQKGALTITAKGIASHDAQKGTMVKVRNSNSQKEIFCRAVAPGQVRVEI